MKTCLNFSFRKIISSVLLASMVVSLTSCTGCGVMEDQKA